MSFDLPTPEGWKVVKLNDLGEVNRGRSRHRPRDANHLYGGQYPFVQTGDVKASRGRVSNHTQTYTEAGLAQSRLWPKGTMCITIAANIAETGILQYPACFPDSVIGFIPDSNKCNVHFIEYTFRLLKRRIQAQATGSVQDNINLKTLESLYFPIPSIEKQNQISDFLCKLDDKIELNRQTNQTLEEIAQAIFKSWFVDFDPTRAKIAAKQTGDDPERAAMAALSGKPVDALDQLAPAQLAELKATAALFPDALVECELGEVPEGWEVGTLSDITEFAKDRVDTSALTLDTYISTENMLEGKKGITTAASLPTTKTVPRFEPDQVLISNIRPYFKKIWMTRFEGGRSNDVLGFIPKNKEDITYLYNMLYQDEFFGFMMTTSKGAKMPRGDKTAIMGWTCILPPNEIRTTYSKKLYMFYDAIDSTNQENKSLELARDTLLPKLLSGELSVPPSPTEAR